MWLSTFAKGAIVGAATGFILGFAFFPICPIDLPFWGLWFGLPIGGLLFLLLPTTPLRILFATLWYSAFLGFLINALIILLTPYR